jgi:hypothetical protein
VPSRIVNGLSLLPACAVRRPVCIALRALRRRSGYPALCQACTNSALCTIGERCNYFAAIAQSPKATFVTRLQPFRLPGRAAPQLPDQSTTLWVESSSTDDSRLRGARPAADNRDVSPFFELRSSALELRYELKPRHFRVRSFFHGISAYISRSVHIYDECERYRAAFLRP